MKFSAFVFAALLALTTGCADSALDQTDPVAGLSREDYRGLHARDESDAGPPVPHLPLRLDDAEKPRLASGKKLSISVTDKIPLKDVLMELGARAGVDMEIDPRISGGVNFTASRQSFSRVLDRICGMAGLRHDVDGDVVRVELDDPYLKTYSLDYLSLSRKAKSEIGIATNVFASVQGATRAGGVVTASQDARNGNNSLTKVASEGEADFWKEVEANLDALLANTGRERGGKARAKPFSINRQAGLINVFGDSRQQKTVAKYLKRLRRDSNAQVLIEARIIEVSLDESYRSGINWRSLLDSSFNAAARFGPGAVGAPFSTPATATDGVMTLSLKTGDFGGILNFMRHFGTSRTLSSPRLTVLNNQPAVLKVARNEVYFTSTIETTPIIGSTGGSPVAVQRTVNSTPNTVPIGFLMTVQPAIDLDGGEVTLNLRPTVSYIVDRVEDPGVRIAAADANVPDVTSSIPVVAVREMDSVLTLPSGGVAVMGGLMQDSARNSENGIPLADEVPVFGNLAKSRDTASHLTELVILLRASIVEGGPAPDRKDRDLYKRFTQDRHPLPLKAEGARAPGSMIPPGNAAMMDGGPEDVLPGGFIPATYNMGEGAPFAREAAYYKIKKKKKKKAEEKIEEKVEEEEDKKDEDITPSEEKKLEEKKPEKKLKKKPEKKRKKRRGASRPVAPLGVSPPRPAPEPIPPTIVPRYDTRPDTMPEDQVQ